MMFKEPRGESSFVKWDESLLVLSGFVYILFLDSRISENGTHLSRTLSLRLLPLFEKMSQFLRLANAGVTDRQHLPLDVTGLGVQF